MVDFGGLHDFVFTPLANTNKKGRHNKKGHQGGFAPLMASDSFELPKLQTGPVTTTRIIPATGTVGEIRLVKLESIARSSSVLPKFGKCKWRMA